MERYSLAEKLHCINGGEKGEHCREWGLLRRSKTNDQMKKKHAS